MIRFLLLTLTVAVGLALPAQADPMADLRAGNASFKEGRYDDAVQAYTRAIISGQLGVEALAVTFNNRGVAYGELGDFDRAIIDYNEALGLRPDDATSIRNLRVGHVKRGVAEANLGEKDRAVADFTKAIELDPSHFLAYLRRGQLRSDDGQLELAIVDLETAQNLAPDNAQAVELLTKARQMQAESRAPAPDAEAAVEPAAPPLTQEPEVAAAPPMRVPTDAGPAAADQAPSRAAPAPPAAAPSIAAPSADSAEPVRPQRDVASSEPTGGADRRRVRQAVNMRAGPGNDFERLITLPGGEVGTVLGEKQGWYHLELSSGQRGWIYERWLEQAP